MTKKYIVIDPETLIEEKIPNLMDDFYTCGWNDAIDMVLQSEAKEVAEVKHGKWLREYEPDGTLYCFHCSVCDDDFHNISHKSITKFCSDCGAIMDGDSITTGIYDCETCKNLCCDGCEMYEGAMKSSE